LLGWLLLSLVACAPPMETGVLATEYGTLVRPHFDKGQSYSVIRTMKETLKATDSPQGSWEMNNTIEREWNYVVSKKKRSGQSVHDGNLTRLKIVFDLPPQGIQTYDSETSSSGPLSNAYRGYVGGAYQLVYSPWFALEKISAEPGFIEEDMFRKNESYNAGTWYREKAALESFFPTVGGQIRSPWERHFEVRCFYPIAVDATYSLTEAATNQWTIEMNGTVSPPSNRVQTVEMGFKIDYAWQGNITGTYAVDSESGRLLRGQHQLDLTGTCSMQLPDESQVNVPVTLQQTETSIFTYP